MEKGIRDEATAKIERAAAETKAKIAGNEDNATFDGADGRTAIWLNQFFTSSDVTLRWEIRGEKTGSGNASGSKAAGSGRANERLRMLHGNDGTFVCIGDHKGVKKHASILRELSGLSGN
jgi:hypothetical protein